MGVSEMGVEANARISEEKGLFLVFWISQVLFGTLWESVKRQKEGEKQPEKADLQERQADTP